MLWSVASRFGFDGFDMKISRLVFWYNGHCKIHEEETKALNGK
jgi:hypothetical protein